MRLARAFISSLVVLTLGALAGCGSHGRGGLDSNATIARGLSAPLDAPVSLVSSEGAVAYRSADSREWRTLEAGQRALGVVALRTSGGGAVLDVGDGRGRLWLRDDTSIELGKDDSGEVRAVVAKGEARLRHGARDQLYFAHAGQTAELETRKNLREADFSLELETTREARGVGAMEARGPAGQIAPVSLKRLEVKATQVGDYAETEVTHVFTSESDQRLEGTFRFPMPDGAILTGLAMQIDEKLMEGELVERDKAEKVFQEIVDQMEDPALLEWEHGNVFKLRVFPIDPGHEKRVVLRFVAPLRRGVDGWEYVYPTSATDPAMAATAFHLEMRGNGVVQDRPLGAAREVVVPLGGGVPDAVRETREDSVYTAVRVRPDWSKLPEPSRTRAPRRLAVIVDTSRSALEERQLELEALKMILSELGPEDAFVTIASDVAARVQAPELTAVNAASIESAQAFVRRFEPDGASDLGAALRAVGRIRKSAPDKALEVIYIGDGTPTWGETEPAALEALAKESLGGAVLHAMILGPNGDADGMRDVVTATGGRLDHPHTLLDAKRFALRLAERPNVKELLGAHVRAGDTDVVFPSAGETLVEGEELSAVIKSPKGKTLPSEVVLEGTVAGKPFTQKIALGTALGAPHVAQRWAKDEILRLEGDGAEKKDEVVRTSLAFGIMSRYTSFLVLESEEAYAKYDIERKQKKRAEEAEAARRVTGGDLESVNARSARLEPDHLQPGDPEIQIPAPADAQSVVVMFPFGETKMASFEGGSVNAWTVRFLIDKETPDGTYEVLVRITHKDGQVETLKLPYVVDTKKPTVEVSLHAVRGKPGTYEIRASQILTTTEVHAAFPATLTEGVAPAELKKRFANVLTDAWRVEVRLPDGVVLPLTAIRLGEFRGTWTPEQPISGPVTLHVVAVDRAMNQSVFDKNLAPEK